MLLKSAYKKRASGFDAQKMELEATVTELKKQFADEAQERGNFELEKKKTLEKNKKIWEMSETVYKEKRRVDEQLELLQTEKDKLEVEKKKVDEKVKKLWTQSTAIHNEKERINELKVEIEGKHREVIDSVNYAKRIQQAILPSTNEITNYFPNSFVLFKPRNIVSGDFYWFAEKNGIKIIACVDCTGHGVPGAFMSMIGNILLHYIVNDKGVTDPAEILFELNKEVNRALRQAEGGSNSRDGMDAAICCFQPQETNSNNPVVEKSITLKYAGANRPLYLIKNNELSEIKADKFAVGGVDFNDMKKFTTQSLEIKEEEFIYISTDGYADQFGLEENKKLKTKKFKEILMSIREQPFDEQNRYLDSFIEEWKGNQEQTDDMLVIGIKPL